MNDAQKLKFFILSKLEPQHKTPLKFDVKTLEKLAKQNSKVDYSKLFKWHKEPKNK